MARKSKTKLDPALNYNRRNSPHFIQTIGKTPAESAETLREVLNITYLEECILKLGLAATKEAKEKTA